MLVLVGDFETTVENDRNQESTEVWASALVELFTEKVIILNSIADTFYYLLSLKQNIVLYYHNLKFDGSFWIDYLFRHQNFKNGFKPGTKTFKNQKELNNNEMTYLISNFGEWYSITFKINGKVIEIRDSLKLVRYSVDEIGDSFKTKHKKLNMDYYGEHYAGCFISDEEKQYISNDVLVVKEVLEIFYNEKHKKLTIGSCCMSEFYRSLKYEGIDFDEYFPNLDIPLFPGSDETIHSFVKKTYRGGWCYLKKGCENTVFINGATFDNNSLYPSRMLEEDFPIGLPEYGTGKPVFNQKRKYCFIHIKVCFYLKENYLPTLLINNNLRYGPSYYAVNSLPSNDFTRKTVTIDGVTYDDHMELWLTETDFMLFQKHYNIIDIEYIDYLIFNTAPGAYLFEPYLEKYKRIKENSEGGTRQVAKLFSNNLGGKFGTSTNATYKVASLPKEKDIVSFENVIAEKPSVYCPVAAVMTATGRKVTIEAAQKNYKDFIYSDTDSLHLKTRHPVGIKIDSKKYGFWDKETEWKQGYFIRQKTYIEENEDAYVEKHGDFTLCCAGLPKNCKNKFIDEIKNGTKKITDFKQGLKIFGKLQSKRIKGGVILYEDYFTMQ